jgi:parallel beta-helix repeat protein
VYNNWSATASLYEWCSGSGTQTDPYTISNVTIDGKGAGNCILIESTSEYFKIENSILSNAGTNQQYDIAGIKLKAVSNAYLINNTSSNNNDNGVVLSGCTNITLESNVIEHNYWQGILSDSLNLNITRNIVNDNYYGITGYMENTNILHNSVTNNLARGINLRNYNSNSSQISSNRINFNGGGIRVDGSCIISNNFLNYNEGNGISIPYSWSHTGLGTNSCVLINNTIMNSKNGISISSSNNSIFKNVIRNNEHGLIITSNKNIILNNQIINNEFEGISLSNAHENNISENFIFNNEVGLLLSQSNYNNIISNNFTLNGKAYSEEGCVDNVFLDNWIKNRPKSNNLDLFGLVVIILLMSMIGIPTVIFLVNKSKKRKEEKELDIKIEIRKSVIQMAKKKTRITITDIQKKVDSSPKLIKRVITDMIRKDEIKAKLYESTNTLVFSTQMVKEEIDKLLQIYRDWEIDKGDKYDKKKYEE